MLTLRCIDNFISGIEATNDILIVTGFTYDVVDDDIIHLIPKHSKYKAVEHMYCST